MKTQIAPCRPTGNAKKARSGIGMPETLYLQEFGDMLYHAFGEHPYHVGSSLTGATWRDVDVRVMMNAEKYAAMGFGDPKSPHNNARWCSYAMAFSALGRQMTGLPIDFQVQETDTANAEHRTPRSALILCSIRRAICVALCLSLCSCLSPHKLKEEKYQVGPDTYFEGPDWIPHYQRNYDESEADHQKRLRSYGIHPAYPPTR